jgi:hypothetical protein
VENLYNQGSPIGCLDFRGQLYMRSTMSTPQPSGTEQDRLEEEIFQTLRADTEGELRRLAKLLAATPDEQLFGRTEFEIRDRALRVGAKALTAALAARKKGGTRVPV